MPAHRSRKNRRWHPLRLGSWLKRMRRSSLAALCGVSLAAGLWYGVPPMTHKITSHSYFALTDIRIAGNRRLTRPEILQWAGVNPTTSAWNAAPETVRLRLQSHPWIEHAGVQREFPNRLLIEVRERHPVAIARFSDLEYVDRRGNILGPLREGDSPDFPLITGLEDATVSQFTPVGLRRALRFLRVCERLKGFDAISEVHVDRDRGITVFPLRAAVAVVLGWGSWREKLARSARVFAAWEGQVERLAAVDVSFHDLVVVKLQEEHPRPAARTNRARAQRT